MKAHLRTAALIMLLFVISISACNAPGLSTPVIADTPRAELTTEPTAPSPTITPHQQTEPVELDPGTLLNDEQVAELLGGETQGMPAPGTGGCSYIMQGESPTETSQLIVSAAMGEEAKSLTLLSLVMLAGFSGDASLQSEFEAINQDAPSLDLIQLIETLADLL